VESQRRTRSYDPLVPQDPQYVGQYQILARLGEGGMGAVYLGRGSDGRKVAIKVVRPELAQDPGFVARFHDEVAHAQRVASFCTAQVLDHGESGGRAYMVTEFIDGTTLLDHVRENGGLSPGLLQGVAVGVAAGLVAIHSAGIIHRDLKPGNVLLSITGPRVIDFGIARALDSASSHTMTGQLIGSPGWMAPEQVSGQTLTTAADIFAWGCLLAYAANARHPFGQGSLPEMAVRVVHTQPEVGDLPAPLDQLVRAALDKDPLRRPSARELLLTLVGGNAGEAAVMGTLNTSWQQAPDVHLPPPARTPEEPVTTPALARAAPGGRKSTLAAGALAIVLVAAGGVAAWQILGSPSSKRTAAPAVAGLPTGILLVRTDKALGWPTVKQCHSNVGTVKPGEAHATILLNDTTCDFLPRWSADHTQIAFTRCFTETACSLMTMSASGTGVKTVTDKVGGMTRVTWSPDGKQLAYMANDASGVRQIHLINADGTGDRTLTTDPRDKDDPEFSPKEQRLVFWSKKTGHQQVYTLDVASPAAWTQVTHGTVDANDPDWSPDGTKIAYTYPTSMDPAPKTSDIHVIGVDGTGDRRLTSTLNARDTDPTWSRDGYWIAFTRGQNDSPYVYAIRVNGSALNGIGPAGTAQPDWG
jgi:predicted Ser/Thr protein kinase